MLLFFAIFLVVSLFANWMLVLSLGAGRKQLARWRERAQTATTALQSAEEALVAERRLTRGLVEPPELERWRLEIVPTHVKVLGIFRETNFSFYAVNPTERREVASSTSVDYQSTREFAMEVIGDMNCS